MNKFTIGAVSVLIGAVSVLLNACGPDFGYGDCLSCKSGEQSAESVKGNGQVPMVVNVTVIVGQDQNQSQVVTPSASPPPVHFDAGVSESTPNPDAGACHEEEHESHHGNCRVVCVQVRKHDNCHGNGNHYGHFKCVKEELQCS